MRQRADNVLHSGDLLGSEALLISDMSSVLRTRRSFLILLSLERRSIRQ